MPRLACLLPQNIPPHNSLFYFWAPYSFCIPMCVLYALPLPLWSFFLPSHILKALTSDSTLTYISQIITFLSYVCFSTSNSPPLPTFFLPYSYEKLFCLILLLLWIIFFLQPLILIIYCLKSKIIIGLLPSLTVTCCLLLTCFSCTHSLEFSIPHKSSLFVS